ncbi:Oxygen-independent coproporphyrinogen-III oxidase-like protein YqeR [bacterium HR34]|nr:Oxygen-independent coproporphyrinogen-III oxidase-like protein YqeR [bacterium HR34]
MQKIIEKEIKNKLIEAIKTGKTNQHYLDSIKRYISKKYKIPIISNRELIKVYKKIVKRKKALKSKKIEDILRVRKVRSTSGVVIVSVLTKPYPCGGACLFCPAEKGVPKSYLSNEPAVMRALLNKYNPYKQVYSRLKALDENLHPIDKVDLRIIGGTWSYHPKNYQKYFIKECFRACDNYGRKKPLPFNTDLLKLQKINEKTKSRIIGINVETRPDYINPQEVKRLRELGITRIELGVQTIYDDILEKNNRGHGVKEIIEATELLKIAGFKICYQMMPNLPFSTPEKDIKMFKEIFDNPKFRPDHLKIYPLALVKEAPLYYIKDKIGFKVYSYKELVDILKEVKKHIPYYCRIQRVIRDIPATSILEGGTKVSNLREIVLKELEKEGLKCKCIRCREVKNNFSPNDKIYLFKEEYEASNGKEIFLSFETKNRDKLFSILRLRFNYPSENLKEVQKQLKVLKDSALIRELQTFGKLSSIGEKEKLSPQHKGLGKKLMEEAEKIAKKEGVKKMCVISGVGVRDYYRKLGYNLQETYMVKKL